MITKQANFDTLWHTDDSQVLVGIAIYGEAKKVNKAIDGLKFHS